MRLGQAEGDDGTDSAVLSAPFQHVAMLYAGDDEFLAGTMAFLEAGLDAGEPALVSVPAERLDLLRRGLGPSTGELVRLVPMEDMGRNPAWIIPAWAEFVAPHLAEGGRVRGIGEPIWAGRSDDELVECGRHESLLNLAMADADGFTLLCPYDVDTLADHVIDDALHHHPSVENEGVLGASASYRDTIPAQLSDPLSDPPASAVEVTFSGGGAWALRRQVADAAAAAGLPDESLEDLTVAVSEALTNSLTHGGGSGELAWWADDDRFVCEIRDHGSIADPLVGRVRPGADHSGGRGMWLIHQLCDLVQIRAFADGRQVVRLHLSI